MRNILLTIAYDGTNFCGWQRQPGQRTVQGELERVLSVLCAQEIRLNGTSRTDAGVHAIGQCASFQGNFKIPTENIPKAANNLLAAGLGPFGVGDVRITAAKEVPSEFHARFSSHGKRYVYRIANSSTPDLFQRNYCYYVKDPLNEKIMQEAASAVVGEHDFRCFMAAGGQEMESTVRTVYRLAVERQGSDIIITVEGNGFLYNMVRIITGTLVEIGLGKRKPEEMEQIIASRDRRQAGHTAPPQGLYLMEVFYENQPNVSYTENSHFPGGFSAQARLSARGNL